ncbi:MAG TPA: DUF4097 family beta strand repeat-containing protein [Candidatus Koribacter sp.]|jgi:DUF4097 and DUF4098 domain-containing protein YvlB
MASPVYVAPPPPRRKSYAGAIVLILLGVIFLMHNFGFISGWHFYARWWPLIIIVLGAVKLLEYFQAKQENTVPSGVTFGTIVLLFFVIVSGMVISKAEGVNWRGVRDQMGIDLGDDDFNHFGQNSYTYEDRVEQAFPAGGSLKIVCDSGNINVNASDDNNIRVMIHKKVWANNQGDADSANTSTKPRIEVNGTALVLNANTQAGGKHDVEADMDVFIPKKADVTLNTRHGDVNIVGRDGQLTVSHQNGTANFEDITGNVDVQGEKITVRATRINGNLTVQGRVTEITAEDISGNTTLNGDNFDEVRVSKVGKALAFKSYRTDLQFAGLAGDFDMSSDDLRATNITGPVKLITTSKTIHLDDVSGDVRIENSNGDVDVHATKLGNYEVRNHHGDVTVTVPAKSTFSVDAKTQHGDAASDFGELKVNNGDNEGAVSGNVGSGGPKVTITTDGADVNIRKSS